MGFRTPPLFTQKRQLFARGLRSVPLTLPESGRRPEVSLTPSLVQPDPKPSSGWLPTRRARDAGGSTSTRTETSSPTYPRSIGKQGTVLEIMVALKRKDVQQGDSRYLHTLCIDRLSAFPAFIGGKHLDAVFMTYRMNNLNASRFE